MIRNSMIPGSVMTDRGQHTHLRSDFDSNDVNHDGRLTLNEFIRFVENNNEEMTTGNVKPHSMRSIPTATARSTSLTCSPGGMSEPEWPYAIRRGRAPSRVAFASGGRRPGAIITSDDSP